MAGRRRISALIVLLAGTVLFESGAVAGPNLPPAPYKPLPVGTRLDYGSWNCTVENSDGFETVCADRQSIASTYGVFTALFDESVEEQMMGSVAEGMCEGHAPPWTPFGPVSIDDEARSSIEKM